MRERAPRHRAVPRRPVGTNKKDVGSRSPTTRRRDREFANVRGRRLSSRGRFRGATRYRRLVREASIAARSPVPAGDLARARRRRAFARASVLTFFGRDAEKTRPSGEDPPMKSRGIAREFALLWSHRLRDRVGRERTGINSGFATFGNTDRLGFRQFFGLETCLAHSGNNSSLNPLKRQLTSNQS